MSTARVTAERGWQGSTFPDLFGPLIALRAV